MALFFFAGSALRHPVHTRGFAVFPVNETRWVTFGLFGTLIDRDVRPAIRPLADVEPLLAELRARGYRLAVLTNSDDELFEAAHRAFRSPFDLFVTAERIRGYKPAPWHFRAFELLAHARRDRWVHVASSWYHDIVPANAFGVERVWLDRSRSGEDASIASVHVHTTRDAVAAVDRLFQHSVVGHSLAACGH
jgi:FMN phosphatase YigB (HAD superfamily)